MIRFLLLPISRPVGVALERVRGHLPRVSRLVAPEDSRRRDFLRAVVGLPVALLSVSALSSGCVYDTTGTATFGESEVDSFRVNQDGDTLEQQLQTRAQYLGLELAWHNSVAPDQMDAKAASVTGWRLVAWDYKPGNTATKFYRFEVYTSADRSDPLDESEVSLTLILQEDWEVVVVEVQNPLAT